MTLDWKVTSLVEMAVLQRGFDLPHRDREEGVVPIVTSSGWEDIHSVARVNGPGVVTGRYGTIGKVFFVREDFWPLNTTLYVKDFCGNDPEYIYYLLKTIDFASHSGKSGVPGVNRNDLHKLDVACPTSIDEQQAIAEALSDADALIDSLEQLIVKKQLIKQGAMQELLTGKRRLPGFDGEWADVVLSEIGSFLKGSGVRKDQSASGEIPCVRYGEIYNVHNEYIKSFASHISINVAATAEKLRYGDLLFAGSGETREEIGKCVAFVDDVLAFAGGDIVIFRSPAIQPMFFGFLLNAPHVVAQKSSKGQGDAVVHISAKALGSIAISVPSLGEQSAIAQTLTDIDTEITALESRLSKAHQIKQGMMQELLTGRIRLMKPTVQTA